MSPLNGAEKVFANLPGALARRGHDVHVYNRATVADVIEGARWHTMAVPPATRSDVLIAYRKTNLLGFVEETHRRILWLAGSAARLSEGPARERLDRFQPALIFQSEAQRATWTGQPDLDVKVIPPAVGWHFRQETPTDPVDPPRAIFTSHPLRGLAWTLDLWRERIHPECPAAELHVFSSSLHAALNGATVDDRLRPIMEALGRCEGVMVRAPAADPDMAAEYRAARVHLFPSDSLEMVALTLAESQATGLPAVARPLGAAAERIVDGETGRLVADGPGFAQAAVGYLADANLYLEASARAMGLQRSRTADTTAGFYEALFS
ncbi:MAG: glycosyltransferase [Alphaproteobacteria bacterium]